MSEKVIINWKFEPVDYFESKYEKDYSTYQILIESGEINVYITNEFYSNNPQIENGIFNTINAIFKGVEIFNHKPFKINDETLIRIDENGREHISKNISDSITINDSIVISCDVKGKKYSSNGTLIQNIKDDSIKERNHWIEVSEILQRDSTGAAIIDSYLKTILNPANEFFHLYEIIDILKTYFGNESKAIGQLKFSKSDWKELKKLSNGIPLTQGRHQGCHINNLRPATSSELEKARQIAKELILSYYKYIT